MVATRSSREDYFRKIFCVRGRKKLFRAPQSRCNVEADSPRRLRQKNIPPRIIEAGRGVFQIPLHFLIQISLCARGANRAILRLKKKSKWSGGRDSNPRPSGPKPDALPDCATARLMQNLNSRHCRKKTNHLRTLVKLFRLRKNAGFGELAAFLFAAELRLKRRVFLTGKIFAFLTAAVRFFPSRFAFESSESPIR